jgi:hypothetical protein
MEKTYTIMVLEDGETYSSVEGCEIITLTQDGMDLLCEGYRPSHLDEKEILLQIRLG